MTNGTALPLERPSGAKMWVRIYTVTTEGIVIPPRATVSVPHGYEPALESLGTDLGPCRCPVHRRAGAR